MKKKLNFDILESLRGLASLYVCIGHCRAILWIGGEHFLKLHPRDTLRTWDYALLGMNMLTRLTSEFVIIFFVLSGFSIAHSLRNSTKPAPFYKRRFIRLYPPYIAALFWAMLVFQIIKLLLPHFVDGTYNTDNFSRLSASSHLFDWKVILQNLIYLPRLDGLLGPFWSLTQEVIFYILAPLLFRNKKMYYILSIVMFFLVNFATHNHWLRESIITQYFYYNIFFAIGVGFYNHFDLVRQKAGIFLTSKTLWISSAVFFLMVAISSYNHDSQNLFLTIINEFIAGFMSTILILYLLSRDVQIKWLIGIGRLSYTLYITHYPTIFLFMSLYFLITRATPPYIYNNFLFIPCVLFCLLIAYMQYSLVEKRTKYFLDKLRRRDEDKVPRTPVPASEVLGSKK